MVRGGGGTQIIWTSIPLRKVDSGFLLGEVIAHELFVHVKFAATKFCHTKFKCYLISDTTNMVIPKYKSSIRDAASRVVLRLYAAKKLFYEFIGPRLGSECFVRTKRIAPIEAKKSRKFLRTEIETTHYLIMFYLSIGCCTLLFS